MDFYRGEDFFCREILGESAATFGSKGFRQCGDIWNFVLDESLTDAALDGVILDQTSQRSLTAELRRLRQYFNESRPVRFPQVPSFNAVLMWEKEGNINEISLAPSVRGPAERIRGGAIVR